MHSQHCDIFKTWDARYYVRLKIAPHSEHFDFYGPCKAGRLALDSPQQAHGVGDEFYLDESGRRSVPMAMQPADTSV